MAEWGSEETRIARELGLPLHGVDVVMRSNERGEAGGPLSGRRWDLGAGGLRQPGGAWGEPAGLHGYSCSVSPPIAASAPTTPGGVDGKAARGARPGADEFRFFRDSRLSRKRISAAFFSVSLQ